ncbi:mucin-binding protein [Limosilactobacillus mucosae]
MVGKNNNYVRESKSNEHFQRFALRKLSVGVVSVAVAAGFYLGSGTTAQAATAESDASAKTEQVVQQDANSTASDSTSASNSSAAMSTSSATPVSAESASSAAVSDSPASASSASDSQASAANASEISSQPASSSVASDAAATVSKDSQAASEANSQSAADEQTAQLPTSAANANESQATNILSAQAVQQAANQQAPAGFTVTDPTYPAGMYQDTDASHYTYWWAQSSDGKYNLVLSTDRNGDGKVYVFLLGRNNNVLGQYTVDKNKSTEVATDDEGDFGTVYNDGQSGVFVSADGSWKSKFNVFDPKAGEDNGDYGSISFMIPQVETQTTTYVDGKGNTVSDPVVQKGLDGQIYTTQGGKVINGYFAKEPSNANGFMSPFGKQGATYTKDWHDGLKATFTETDTTTGLMHVVVKYHYFLGWRTVKEFDLAPGQSQKVHYDLYKSVTIHSIYIPQTINIQYVYEKLGNLIIDSDSKAFPAEDKTTTQYPNDENDSTKAGNVTIPKVPGFTPTINGKTVTNYTFNPADYVSDLSQDITVVYEADWQQAQVNFYDETAGQQIDGTHEIQNGKTGETISFTKDPNEVVKELEAKGYVFDKDNAKNNVFTTGTTYDNDSTVHQYFNYYFKHGTQDVSDTDKEAKTTATRTINVTMPDGKTSSETQTVNYKRTATKDLVNGHITYGQWQADGASAWEEYTPTPQKGYTTLINGVAGTKVAQKTPSFKDDKPVNETVNVTYQADAQRAVIKYIDGETSENLQKTDDIVDGHTNETINYSTADKIKEFVGKGYELVSNDFKPGTKFDNDDKTDQTYTVIFKHHRENVDPNHSSADGTKGTKTLTETVRYKYANGAKAAEDQTAQVTFTRNGVLDDVTGIVAWGKWNEASQSYKALTSPTIAGYTPSETVVKRSSNSDAEQGPTVTVIYTADAQKVHVQYIDGETDKLLRQDNLNGYTDETIPYSTAEGIKKFEGDGYELFKDNFPAGEKFDNDDKTDQTYTVIFKHHRENVDPNHSSADGTKGTKTLTETVHYKYANGTKAAEDQTAQVTFTRNGVLDDVTGIVAWGKWNEASQSYKALTSPTIAGYTPSETVVKRSSNSDAEQGPTLTVIYTADAQKVHVQYIDGETDKLLRQDDLDGYTDETIPYSTAEGIKKFEGDGYELFKDNFPAGEKFDNDDKNDQTYTVIFKHHRENVDPNHSSADGTKGTKTLTETVHYKYADGTKAAEDQTAQVTFTRNGVLDDVTGIVAWGKWNEASQSYKALTSPTIAGYTPSEAVVKRSSNSDAEQGPTVTVIYTADAQTAYVKYIDDTTGETLRQDDLHGYTDETIPYSTAEGIKKFEGDGYVLVSDGFKPGTKFGVGTPTYEVHFKHGTTHTSATDENADQKTVTETIHYVDENNQTVQPDYTAAVTFKRGYTTDSVTGKVVSYDPWTIDGKQADSKTFAAVTSPAVEGYTPNHQQINEFTVTPDSKDIVKTVVYVGDPQEAQAIFYDETTGKEISNTREFATGKTDETISFTKDPNEVVKELEKQGYVFDKDNANNNVFAAGTTYDKNSEVHQYFKYYFTHATTIVTPDNPKTPADVLPDNPGKNYPSGVAKDDLNKTVTRTINITTPDGKTQTVTQKAEFTRSATVDEVTGEVTYGPWSKNVVLESVDVPNIPGYEPSASVPEITVTPNDQDMTINITYKKLDSGKAADQGGNASNGGQATNGGSTTGQSAQNGQSGQTQNNAGAQQLPQTGNANNEKGALGLAGAMFAAGLGLGFGSKKKRHEN